jgi:hypothetical protein
MRPNPSLEWTATGKAPWAARRRGTCCTSRPRRLAGVRPSAQTLGSTGTTGVRLRVCRGSHRNAEGTSATAQRSARTATQVRGRRICDQGTRETLQAQALAESLNPAHPSFHPLWRLRPKPESRSWPLGSGPPRRLLPQAPAPRTKPLRVQCSLLHKLGHA